MMKSLGVKTYYFVTGVLVITVMLMTMVMVNASENNADLPKNLRIGLVTYYEHVDSVHIYNKTVVPGFNVGGEFVAESTISTNGSDYWFSPATRLYLESDQVFGTYEEALEKVMPLRESGYKAYATLVASRTWKVFVGHKNSQSEIDKVKNAVNGLNEVTYVNAPVSYERIIMESASNYPIMFENRYDHVQLSTMDMRGDDRVIDLGKRSYRGNIEVGRYGWNDLSVVNELEIDDYLYSVVVSEIYAKWPEESIKAQAVAARSYALYHVIVYGKYKDKPYDLNDTVNSQVYKGYAIEDERVNSAVDATSGEMVYYEDEVIPAYFFAASGGRTESSQNVWEGNVAYLQSVSDIYEQQPERYPWIKEYSSGDIENKLANKGINIGSIKDMQAIGYSDAGRVITLRIIGTNGSYDLVKEKMRYTLGMYSRKFTIIKSNFKPDTTYDAVTSDGTTSVNYNGAYVVNGDGQVKQLLNGTDQVIVMSSENIVNQPMISGRSGKFILAGQGWGHGVGMSQAGAKGMALEGFDYVEILEHYYTGTKVE